MRPLPGQSFRRPASPDRVVAHVGTSGVVLALDLAGLAAQAKRANGIIEFVRQVGDFVAVGRTAVPLVRRRAEHRRRSAAGGRRPGLRADHRAKIPPLPFAFSSISRSRRRHRPSTIRPRPCSASTSFTVCFGRSASAISARRRSATRPATRGLCSGRRTGRTSYTLRAPKYVIAGRGASRSFGGCIPCWESSCKPCHWIVTPN